MTEKDLLFHDVEHELAITRRTLEVIPDEKMDWAPHEKSTKLGQLASHVADLPSFGTAVLSKDEFDFMSPDLKWANFSTTAEILADFDKKAETLLDTIKKVDSASLLETWTLRSGDNILAKDNRFRSFRMFVLSHIVHHRAQLGVYLRLLDIPVPSVYGPTADYPSGPLN